MQVTMTKKIITVVGAGDGDGDNKKRTFALTKEADYKEILSDFNVLGLKDDDGVEIIAFETLESGQSYTLGEQRQQVLATYPPITLPNRSPRTPAGLPRLPPSPPRNGIANAVFVLAREHLVSDIIDGDRPIVVIRSAPATGKTSLLDLTEKALLQRDDTKVVRFPIIRGEDAILKSWRVCSARVCRMKLNRFLVIHGF